MPKVKCQFCGYTWNYKGKLDYATCPNCTYKTRVKPLRKKVK